MPFATINNHSLHYTDIPPSNPSPSTPSQTLIFIHGLGSTQNYFYPLLPHLYSHRLIIFDNHGAGRSLLSTISSNPSISIPSLASDVLALLTHLSIPRATLVGYSMGGMIPTTLASQHPDLVLAAILIGPVHPTPSTAEIFHQRIPKVRSHGMEVMANSVPDTATGPTTTPLQKAFIREMILAQSVEGYIAHCRAIENATPPEYQQVKCPTLIIAGEEDKSAPLEGCRVIFEGLGTEGGKKRLEVLKGVGHWHCVERGEEVGRLVREFVDAITGS